MAAATGTVAVLTLVGRVESNAEQCSEEVIRDTEDMEVVTADAGLTTDGLLDMGSQDLGQSNSAQPGSAQEDTGAVSEVPFPGNDAQQSDGCTFQSTLHHRLPIFLMLFGGMFLMRARRISKG